MINKNSLIKDFNKLDDCLGKSYLFRTRLERCLIKSKSYAKRNHFADIEKETQSIEHKLLYICDASNVTSTGTTRSFELLKQDIQSLRDSIQAS